MKKNYPHHAKTGLKVFVVAILKEILAGTSPTRTSLGVTPTVNTSVGPIL